MGLAVLALASTGLGGCQAFLEGPHGWLGAALGEPPPEPGAAKDAATTAPAPETPMTTDTAKVHSLYLGSVAADDAQVADIGRQILATHGTAADAAAAMGLALTVSLPSRAGIDGGGICLVHEAGESIVQELDFLPPATPGAAAQIPGMARGMAVLQARDGVLRWQQAVGLAEKLALSGIAVTPALFADLNAIGMAGGLKIGDVLPQRSVATTLARLRVAGASDIHLGELATRLTAAGVAAEPLARWAPVWRPAIAAGSGDHRLYVPDGAGGTLAAAAWDSLLSATPAEPGAAFATAQSTLHADPLKVVPTTSFAVSDAHGQGVGCTIGMGGMFGTGKLIPGLDIYAAAPVAPATLAPVIALAGSELTAVVTGGGSAVAPVDAAAAAYLILERGSTGTAALSAARSPTDTIGSRIADRLNAVSCPGGSPRNATQCLAAFDPRGGGYAMTADQF
jgi:gamma-glutamyltranspeptidase/glutathione hydrolase